jgi:DNA polymerase-1
MPAPTLFLIDGSNQMYRAYHAIRGLTGPDGRSTNAVYGFVQMLRKLIADHHPTHIAASFDGPEATFRSQISADYKAHRAPMPDDLVEQQPWLHEACEALGVPILNVEGYEADDVLGTLARKAAAAGFDVALVTGDKDFFQLVGGHIRVFNPKDDGTWYDEAGVAAKFGVPPSQVVDVLSLMGDAVDNVKGVPGIGEKGARDLVTTFGSLDALLARADEVPQKKYREALKAHAEDARHSRELVTIHSAVDVPFDEAQLRYAGPRTDRCYALFSALGFRTLTTEFAPTAATVTRTYEVVADLDHLRRVVDAVREAGQLALHLVTDAEAPMRARIIGVALSTAAHQAWYVPLGHTGFMGDGSLDRTEALQLLAPVLEDPRLPTVGHDLKAMIVVLARHGVALRGLGLDTMVAAYVLDATRSSQAIEPLALEHLGYRAQAEEDVRGRGARARAFGELSAEDVLVCAGERSDLAWQLARQYREALGREGLAEVYDTLEQPLIPILATLEQAGVRVDTRALAALSGRLELEMERHASDIYALAGTVFNINSPKQLGEVLFERLQLPVVKRTGTTRTASTAVEVLEELSELHDLPRLILEWRSLAKLKGTYIDALPQLVHPDTGRVHTQFNQAVAATGRLSSSDPNLQNIPIRTALGREIRQAFITDPGWCLVSADYSQIELRVLAHLSGDETLTAAFVRGEDIHDRTARQVFGDTHGLDAHELRRRAKIINYGLLYGKTAFTLARDIGVSQPVAQQFIDAYFAGLPRVRAFIDHTIDEARRTGIVSTLFGRRRAVPDVNSRNGQVRAAAERMAVNMPIQGTAADILKYAMVAIDRALAARRGQARMILTVHDELVCECPAEEAAEVQALMREQMSGAAHLSVPLDVDVGVGTNWKDAKP